MSDQQQQQVHSGSHGGLLGAPGPDGAPGSLGARGFPGNEEPIEVAATIDGRHVVLKLCRSDIVSIIANDILTNGKIARAIRTKGL